MYNISKLKEIFEETKCDVLVAVTKENVQYFSGFSPVCKTLRPYTSDTYIVIHKDDLSTINVIHSLGEIDQVIDKYPDVQLNKVYTYGDFYREYIEADLNNDERKIKEYSQKQYNYNSANEALLAMLKDLKAKSVLLDDEGLNFKKYKEISWKLKNLDLIDGSYEIKRIRSIKTESEIQLLKKSANIIEYAINHINNLSNTSLTEDLIVKEFNKCVASYGGIPVLPMIKIGRQSVGGQRQPSNSVEFPEESFIWFDCDISYKGYWSDVARIIISKHSQYKYQKEYNILHQAQREAIQKLRPGMKASEAYNLVMNYATQNGMKHYKRNHIGHGIGLEPYEMPVLSRDNDQVIEENMVLCIETPYYEYGLGALHVEDLVLIKEEGNIVLNQTSGDLIEWEDE